MKDKAKAVKEKTTTKKASHSTIPSVDSVRITSLETDASVFSVELDEIKTQMQFFYHAIANLYNETRMPSNAAKDWMNRVDDMIGELSKSQHSQCSLINQRIDRLYQELQLLSNARGLDLDMKKIVDGLEQTVHELDEQYGYRCGIVEGTVNNYIRLIGI